MRYVTVFPLPFSFLKYNQFPAPMVGCMAFFINARVRQRAESFIIDGYYYLQSLYETTLSLNYYNHA